MFLQTGGGGKGIRPNQQHQQQQQQQQQQHHHQPHHQSHHQPHHPHAQQQQPPSVHHGHPQQQQQQTHSHHPHQQQQQQQQVQHHLQQQQPQLSYYLYQQSQAPPPSGQHPQAPNNAHQGTVQMAPSPPTQASNVTVTSSAGLGLGGGSSVGNSSSVTNIARQQHAAATAAGVSVSNIQHYTANSAVMQPPTTTTFMTSSYLQYQQPTAAVMAAAVQQFTNSSTGHAGLAGAPNASIYQTQQQQQQQHHHHAHQPLQPALHFYHPGASAAQAGPPHMHQQHHAHPQQHQMRSVLAPHGRQPHGTYMLPPQMFLQAGPLTATPRPSLLASAHQQAGGASSVLQTGARNPGAGPTAYVTPPFCQPPLPIGPPGLTPPQTLLTTSGLQAFSHLSATPTSSVSSTSLSGPNSGTISSSENVKPPRKHAIPIIDPITRENILDPKPAKKNTASEAKPSLAEVGTADAHDQQTTASSDKSITFSFAKDLHQPVLTNASKEKIDQQMQTDAVRDKSTLNMLTHCTDTLQPVSYNDFEEEEEDMDFKPTTLLSDNQTDLYSDIGNEIYVDEEEQIPVLIAADEGVSAATTTTGDEEDDASHYEDVESASLVDVVPDQEDELPTEAIDETKQIQDKTQQAFIAKPQQHELSATNYDAIATNAALNEDFKQTQAAQNTKSSSIRQNIASTTTTVATTTKSSLPLKAVKSTTMVTTTTTTAATITTAAATAVPKAVQKLTPNTSGASSSATSTPTHQQQQLKTQQQPQQQQQQLKKPVVTPVVAAAAISKKNRKAPKRKESQKKLKHTNDNINRSNPSSSSNNNNLNNKSTLNANSLNNNNNNNTNTTTTTTTATATTTSNLTDLNNANNSSSSSNCNLRETASAENLRQQQQQQSRANNNTSSKSGQQPSRSFDKTDPKCDSLAEDTTTTAAGSTAAQRKHVKTQEIVVQFLQPTNASQRTGEEQQLQFLNSSSSACEEDEELQYARLQQQHGNDTAELEGLQFGDVTTGEVTETDKPTELKANPPKVNTSKSNFIPALINAATTTTDAVDCSRNMATIKETKAKVAPKLLTPPKPRKYSLEELKLLAKSSEARKPPLVPCQKGDCIAQLFVSRQQHHHLPHHAHQMSPLVLHPHLQYQHMSFNESMEFVTGKRRGGQPKKHHDHSAGGSSGQSGAGGISVGGGGGGGGMSQSQRKMIHVNLSLNEEIKLSESDNAWQPEALRSKSSNNSPAGPNDDIDAVLKKVRGVLNKLTPDNFEVLLKSMTSIYMNTEEKMQQVMLLIFEKTVSEPNFAPTYAKFCKVLFQEIKAESKSTFTAALIYRIQQEFESNVNDADAKKLKLQPIVDRLEASNDAKERLELQAELEDQEYQFRRRAWGTVRFIGEMYKLQSLTSDRVLTCIESLLEHGCEEKLEYMCKLLTTVGQLLDVVTTPDNMRMDKIFRKIQEFVQKPRGSSKPQPKISSRVRFMMQDVMDLRARNWDQPLAAQRRSTSVKRDDKMHTTSNVNAYEKNSNRVAYGNHNNQRPGRQAESREGGGNGGGGGNYFMQKQQNKQYMQQSQPASQVNIDLNKLKFTSGDESTKLGNSTLYLWRQTGRTPANATAAATNAPAYTLNANAGAHNVGGGFKRQTNQFQILDKHEKASVLQSTTSTSNSSTDDIPSATSTIILCPPKESQKLLTELIEKVLETSSWQEEILKDWQASTANQQVSLMHYLLVDYLHLGGVKSRERMACANIFTHLMRTKSLDKQVFRDAYVLFGELFADVLVDVPNGWTYVFEFLGPILHERLLQFSDIWQPQWTEDTQFTERFVKALIIHFTSEFGANYTRELWHKEFQLDNGQIFMDNQAQWTAFVAANGFQYIYERHFKAPHATDLATVANTSHRSTGEQVQRIEFLLNTASECDLAIDYITTNVHINTNFISHLTKFLCCDYATVMTTTTTNSTTTKPTATEKQQPSAMTKTQLNSELFLSKCTPLLRLCLDARETHEISCLDAIVGSLQQFYDAATANELICSIFGVLYECEVIPKESFEKWYRARSSSEAAAAASLTTTNTGVDTQSHNSHSRGPVARLSSDLHAYMEKLF